MSQITINALIYTNLILILSIGFTLTYMTARIPNFSHGTLAAVGCYVTFHIHRVLNFNPYLAIPVATTLIAGLLLALYILVIRNLVRMGATVIALTISTIALEIIIYAALNIYVEDISERTGIFARYFILREVDFTIMDLPGILIVSTLVSIFLIVGLHLLLTQTKLGISLRATVENPELAEIMGINTELIIAFSWLLTGALAGLAGSILPLWLQATPLTGFYILMSVFAASILGGIRNIYGVMLGAVIVGFTEVYGTVGLARLFGTPAIAAYRLLIPLTIMAVILMVIPTGVSGLIEDYQSTRLAREVAEVDV
ncbi:MAG: branched-chain amino acid ABC transporter permease [Candidatus Heimdallarchaeota archaeon]